MLTILGTIGIWLFAFATEPKTYKLLGHEQK